MMLDYPKIENHLFVLFRTASDPNRWRKGIFYWNSNKPVFASYGSEITDVIDWKEREGDITII